MTINPNIFKNLEETCFQCQCLYYLCNLRCYTCKKDIFDFDYVDKKLNTYVLQELKEHSCLEHEQFESWICTDCKNIFCIECYDYQSCICNKCFYQYNPYNEQEITPIQEYFDNTEIKYKLICHRIKYD